jgi:RimJ/RimL family protein N-acetyltransferase
LHVIDGGESERLVYEPLTMAHASGLTEALTDPRVYQFITGPNPTTTADLKAQFARKALGPLTPPEGDAWWNFAVRVRCGQYIGRIEATFHSGLVEVAYLFGPEHWGRGFATETLHWLHAQIRQSGYSGTFWATVWPDNARSIRLLQSVGYREAPAPWPRLLSFEPGDRVLRRDNSA